jgi:hypothetical protein
MEEALENDKELSHSAHKNKIKWKIHSPAIGRFIVHRISGVLKTISAFEPRHLEL